MARPDPRHESASAKKHATNKREQRWIDSMDSMMGGRNLKDLRAMDLLFMYEDRESASDRSERKRWAARWLLSRGVNIATYVQGGSEAEDVAVAIATGGEVKIDLGGRHKVELKGASARRLEALGGIEAWARGSIQCKHVARLLLASAEARSMSIPQVEKLLAELHDDRDAIKDARERREWLDEHHLICQPGGTAVYRGGSFEDDLRRAEYIKKWRTALEMSETKLGFKVRAARDDLVVTGDPEKMDAARLARFAAQCKRKVLEASTPEKWSQLSVKQRAHAEARKANAFTGRSRARDAKMLAGGYEVENAVEEETRGVVAGVAAAESRDAQRLVSVPKARRDPMWRLAVRRAGELLARDALRSGHDVEPHIAALNGSALLMLTEAEIEAIAPPASHERLFAERAGLIGSAPVAPTLRPESAAGPPAPWFEMPGGAPVLDVWGDEEVRPVDEHALPVEAPPGEDEAVAVRTALGGGRAVALFNRGGGKARKGERERRHRAPRRSQLGSSHGEISEEDDVVSARGLGPALAVSATIFVVAREVATSLGPSVAAEAEVYSLLAVVASSGSVWAALRAGRETQLHATLAVHVGAVIAVLGLSVMHVAMCALIAWRGSDGPRLQQIASSHGEISEGDDVEPERIHTLPPGVMSHVALCASIHRWDLMAVGDAVCVYAAALARDRPGDWERILCAWGPGHVADVCACRLAHAVGERHAARDAISQWLLAHSERWGMASPYGLMLDESSEEDWPDTPRLERQDAFYWSRGSVAPSETELGSSHGEITEGDDVKGPPAALTVEAPPGPPPQQDVPATVAVAASPAGPPAVGAWGPGPVGEAVKRGKGKKAKKGGGQASDQLEVKPGAGAGAATAVVEAHKRAEAEIAQDAKAAAAEEAAPVVAAAPTAEDLAVRLDGSPDGDFKVYTWFSTGVTPSTVVRREDLNELVLRKFFEGDDGWALNTEFQHGWRDALAGLALIVGSLWAALEVAVALTAVGMHWGNRWVWLGQAALAVMTMACAHMLGWHVVRKRSARDMRLLRTSGMSQRNPGIQGVEHLSVAVLKAIVNRSRWGPFSLWNVEPMVTLWSVEVLPRGDTTTDERAFHHRADKLLAQERRVAVTVRRRVLLKNGIMSVSLSSDSSFDGMVHGLHAYSGNLSAVNAEALEQKVTAWVNVSLGARQLNIPAAEKPSVSAAAYWVAMGMAATQQPRSLNSAADVLTGWH